MLTHTRPARHFPGYRFLTGVRHQEKSGTLADSRPLPGGKSRHVATAQIPIAAQVGENSPEGLDRLDFLRTKLARWYLNWTVEQPVLPLFDLMKPDSRRHPMVRRPKETPSWPTGNTRKP